MKTSCKVTLNSILNMSVRCSCVSASSQQWISSLFFAAAAAAEGQDILCECRRRLIQLILSNNSFTCTLECSFTISTFDIRSTSERRTRADSIDSNDTHTHTRAPHTFDKKRKNRIFVSPSNQYLLFFSSLSALTIPLALSLSPPHCPTALYSPYAWDRH